MVYREGEYGNVKKKPVKRCRRAAVHRFYYVASGRGTTAHMATTITQGGRTYCGARIGKGWGWARARDAKQRARRRICANCLKRTH
jgi:hypothetical protein